MQYRWRLILLCLVLAITMTSLFLMTTPQGLSRLFFWGVQTIFSYKEANYNAIGRASEQSTFIDDLSFDGLGQNDDSSVRIQHVLIQDISPFGINIIIEQGRFFSPHIPGPVFFDGSLIGDYVNVHGFAKDISLKAFWDLFDVDGLHLTGDVSDLEFNVSGTLNELFVTGRCRLDSFRSMSFDVVEADMFVRLFFDRRAGKFMPRGEIIMKNGVARTRDREFVLNEAKIVLQENEGTPALSILAQKQVDKVSIFLNANGTKDHMDVGLTSSPALPEDQLWEMLALGAGALPSAEEGRLEGKVSINEGLSVSVDRKVESDDGVAVLDTEEPQEPEDRVMIEFKSQF